MSKIVMSSRRGTGGGQHAHTETETSRLIKANQRSSGSTGGGTFSGGTEHHDQTHAHHQSAAVQQQHYQQQQHYHPPETITNPLECMIKRALTGFALFLALSFLGILLVVLKALGFDAMPAIAQLPPATRSYWVIFTPFWVADLVGWVLVAQTLANTCSLRTTTGTSRDERHHHVARMGAGKGARVIGTEMLPLVQIVVRSILAVVPFLLCLTTAHVLLCMSLQGNVKVPLWLALLPVVIWEALVLLTTLCLRTGSLLKALGWFLTLVATLALSLRFSTPSSAAAASAGNLWPWTTANEAPLWLAFTPFWTLLTIWLLTILYISLQACCVRRYRLTSQHVACLVLYAASLALLALATVLVAWRHERWEAELDHALRFQNFTETLAGIALFCGVGLAELALYLVAAEEADHLVTSQGYEEPVPLSRTARGWEPTGSRTTVWFLLGRVEETARLMRRRGVASTVGGVAGAGMRMAGAAAKGAMQRNSSPLHGVAGSGSGEGGELRRSNSGSYADLYDDL